MSYLLFGITATGGGTRAEWGLGGSAGTTIGRIDGMWLDVAAASLDEAAAAAATAAAKPGRAGFFDLTGIAADGFAASALADALEDGGRVLTATPTGRSVLDVGDTDGDGPGSGYANGTLRLGLAGANWNWIKNVELLLTSLDLESDRFQAIEIFNFVDVRLKLGDFRIAGAPRGEPIRVEVTNAKRGEFDFADAPTAVQLDIAIWSNSAIGQNSHAVTGSAYDDIVTIRPGALTLASELARHGPGTVEGSERVFNGWGSGIAADLGGGDDLFDSAAQRTYGTWPSLRIHETYTLDRVDGGAGNDVIRTGNGSDVIRGGPDRGVIRWETDTGEQPPLLAAIIVGDHLTGGGPYDRDTFHWGKGDGVDLVTDFQPYHDQLVLAGIDGAPTQTAVTCNGVASLLITDGPGDDEGVLLLGIPAPLPDIFVF